MALSLLMKYDVVSCRNRINYHISFYIRQSEYFLLCLEFDITCFVLWYNLVWTTYLTAIDYLLKTQKVYDV